MKVHHTGYLHALVSSTPVVGLSRARGLAVDGTLAAVVVVVVVVEVEVVGELLVTAGLAVVLVVVDVASGGVKHT